MTQTVEFEFELDPILIFSVEAEVFLGRAARDPQDEIPSTVELVRIDVKGSDVKDLSPDHLAAIFIQTRDGVVPLAVAMEARALELASEQN